jgi:hypothetical protein
VVFGPSMTDLTLRFRGWRLRVQYRHQGADVVTLACLDANVPVGDRGRARGATVRFAEPDRDALAAAERRGAASDRTRWVAVAAPATVGPPPTSPPSSASSTRPGPLLRRRRTRRPHRPLHLGGWASTPWPARPISGSARTWGSCAHPGAARGAGARQARAQHRRGPAPLGARRRCRSRPWPRRPPRPTTCAAATGTSSAATKDALMHRAALEGLRRSMG